MKKIILLGLLLVLSTSAFAFVDAGLIKSQRTLGYYLMPNVENQAISSGLVFNSKNDDGSQTEILYTGFRSAFLLTTNITQINAHRKYRVVQYGMLNLDAMVGLGLMYSPATGGGLTADIGAVPIVRFMDNAAVAMPIYGYIFSDGFMMNVSPTMYANPDILKGYEVYGGMRIDIRAVGGFSQMISSGTGSMNTYLTFGIRGAI